MADPIDQLRIDRSGDDRDSPWPRRLLLLGIAAGLVGGAALWLLAGGQAVPVETVTVKEAAAGTAVASVLDASGSVVARRQATVSSKITGRLVEAHIEEGMSVEDGQVLARLDDANARHALAPMEARRAAAESSLKEIEVRLGNAIALLMAVGATFGALIGGITYALAMGFVGGIFPASRAVRAPIALGLRGL